MKEIFILLALLAIQSHTKADVMTLTDKNFNKIIKENPIVMVTFFTHSCGPCKTFIPRFESIANTVKNKTYLFAIINGEENGETVSAENITKYPTLKLYVNGKRFDYSSDRESDPIIAFIKLHSNYSSTELHTVEEVKARRDESGFRCFLAVANDNIKELYVNISKQPVLNKFYFYHAPTEVIHKVIPEAKEDSIVFLRDFDESQLIYNGEMNVKDITDFLLAEMLPVVTQMNRDVSSQLLRKGGKKGVFLILPKDDTDTLKYQMAFRNAAQALRSKEYIFIQLTTKESWGIMMADFLGIDNKVELPLLELVWIEDESFKYRHKGEITEDTISKFIKDVEQGLLPRYYNSEDEPIDNPGPVYKVVTGTFYNEVIANEYDVIVNFYDDYLKKSNDYMNIFEYLAASLKQNPRLKFVKIDVTKNDIEGHPIKGYPTIKFFPGKNKSVSYVYEGKLDVYGTVDFIASKSSHQHEIPEFIEGEDQVITLDESMLPKTDL